MKSLLISDIHGSSLYLKKVLDEVKDFDNLIILGDVLYHGPRNDLPLGYNPKEVVKILNSLKEKIICVKGNCEAYVDEMVLDFPIVESAYFNNGYLNLFLTHGHLINPENPISSIPLLNCLIISLNIVVLPFPGGETNNVLYIVLLSLFTISLMILSAHPFTSLAILKFKLDIFFKFTISPFSTIPVPTIPTLCPPFIVIKPSFI